LATCARGWGVPSWKLRVSRPAAVRDTFSCMNAPASDFGPRGGHTLATFRGMALLALTLLPLGCAGSAAAPSSGAPSSAAPQTAPPTSGGVRWTPEAAIRPEVSGLHGAVVAGHPLAAAAGYEVLRAGGTAADAAVTMAAVLAVVRPHMNGVGGDAFGLFLDAETGQVMALNGSGRAGALSDPQWYAERGLRSIPASGALSVTVPGAVSAWAAALERYGTLTLAEALAPAIRLADEGFPVTLTLAEDLPGATRLNDAGRAIYAPGGTPLEAGERLRNPALANALRRIAEDGPEALYGGDLGAALARFLEEGGSPLRLNDFSNHRAEWTDPAFLDVFGRRVYVTPPNSQGIVLLQMLGIAEARAMAGRMDDPEGWLHDLIEAKKLAFADRDQWVADPAMAPPIPARLLDRGYLAERARLITPTAAPTAPSGVPEGDGDTVYLMAVDPMGNAVSWIQSLFSSFGSGLVEPSTGIVLQNRGSGFTLDAGHPNQIAPGKRPFHTLMATMVTSVDGTFEVAIGTPGGHGQPQTVATGLAYLLLGGLSPQQAVEAPRFRSDDGVRGIIEDRFPGEVRAGLAARGHDFRAVAGWTAPFGNLMIVQRTSSGVLRTGADMRREGAAIAW